MCSNADPRAALADYIRHKTDNGNKVVDYLHDVLHENLDGVKHGHRTRAAAILSRIRRPRRHSLPGKEQGRKEGQALCPAAQARRA